MMPESCYVSSLLQCDIDVFKSFVVGLVEDFYKKYDPVKSLNQQKLLDLISDVHLGLESLKGKLNGKD